MWCCVSGTWYGTHTGEECPPLILTTRFSFLVLFMYNSCCTLCSPGTLTVQHSTAHAAWVKQCLCVLCVCCKCLRYPAQSIFSILLLTDKSTVSVWDVSEHDTSKGDSTYLMLFKLLPIIGFLAPPLSKLHVVISMWSCLMHSAT